jgi:glutaredoxin-related protein
MTCEECLSALETESLREISGDSAVMRHCATCPDCARVTTMVRDKEYETATVLNSLPPMSDPLTLAETAGQTDQRRRVGGVVVTLSAIAGAIIIWIVSATMVVPALFQMRVIGGTPATGVRTETMQLSCLSPQQAEDVIDPYIKGRNSRFYVPNTGISAITVRGTPDELAKSRDLIANFERDPNAACRVTATRLRNTMESVDQAFKDANSDPVLAPTPPTGRGPGLFGRTTGPTLLTPDKATTPPKKE